MFQLYVDKDIDNSVMCRLRVSMIQLYVDKDIAGSVICRLNGYYELNGISISKICKL